MPTRGGEQEQDGTAPQRTKRENARAVIAWTAGVLIIIFAVANFDRVKVHWVVGSAHTPLIVVIAVSFVLGAIVGRPLLTKLEQAARRR
jgi:uncharacterized integral membrane protein